MPHRRALSVGTALLLVSLTAAAGAARGASRAGDHPASGERTRLTTEQRTQGFHLEAVAPGVWRLRIGKPEEFTPSRFRSAPVAKEGLAKLPAADLPFPVAEIRFRALARGGSLELPLEPNEHLFGLGLNMKLFDLTGHRAFVRTSDHPESELNDSHAPVPFYLSTAGYGVYVDTARYACFYAGTASPNSAPAAGDAGHPIATSTEELYRQRGRSGKTVLVDLPGARGIDVYLFSGPTMRDAASRYILYSGGGCLPPLWGLGVAYRGAGSFNAAETLALARSVREDHIPCDVWGVEPGWQSHAYSCSFTWSPDRFPDPDGFLRQMRGMGYHVNLWEHAFTHPTSPLYQPLRPYSGTYQVWGGLVPDFAGPEARKRFGDYHRKELVQKGVDGFKLDECDNQPDAQNQWSWPEASAFPSGIDGEQMHGLFGTLYQQTLWNSLRDEKIRPYGLVRASHALAAPLPFVLYSDAYDHRAYVRALAKSGFAGVLWTPEVRDAHSVEELYRRLETVIFSPQALINAWYMKNPPWRQIDRDKSNRGELMPEHRDVTDTVRRLLQLRMSLIPYLYAAFGSYHETGTPPFRALVMDYPNDSLTWKIDDEYLVGPSLLVAPLFAGQARRAVYLPAGEWYDFRSGHKQEGKRTIEVSAPPDRIPVFVRAGSLLPLAEPVERVEPGTRFALTVRVYGEHPAPLTLLEDDGMSYDYERGVQNRVELRWEGGKGTVRRTGGYRGPERYNIERWQPVR